MGGGLQLEEAPPAPVVLGVISRWGAQGGLPARVVLKGAYLQVGCPGGPACTCGAQGGLPAGGVPRGACMHVALLPSLLGACWWAYLWGMCMRVVWACWGAYLWGMCMRVVWACCWGFLPVMVVVAVLCC